MSETSDTPQDTPKPTAHRPPHPQHPPRRRLHPLRTILVWGPWVVALLALLGVAGVTWINSVHEARLEGAFLANQRMHEEMHSEILLWESYVVVLQRALTQSGIAVPVPPLHPVTKPQPNNPHPPAKGKR